jgi:hypothetical protein
MGIAESTASNGSGRDDGQELRIGGGGRSSMTWVEEGRDLRCIAGTRLAREHRKLPFACAMGRA